MFEKFNQIAEQSATSGSRRQFLGRVGRGAMLAAAAVGGLLALPGEGRAARGDRGPCRRGTCRCRGGGCSYECCGR
jgi:hypothetical protein